MAAPVPPIKVPVELVPPPELTELTKLAHVLEAFCTARCGDVVVLELTANYTDDEVDRFYGALDPMRERTGVEFVLLAQGVRLARIQRDNQGGTVTP